MHGFKYLWLVFKTAWAGSFKATRNALTGLAAVLISIAFSSLGLTIDYTNKFWGLVANFCLTCVGIWILVFLVRLVKAPFDLHRIKENENNALRKELHDLKSRESSNLQSSNTEPAALRFEFADTDEFINVSHLGNGTVVRIVSAMLVNRGNGFITNCYVRIKHVSCPMPDRIIQNMAFSENLSAGHYKKFRLARYPEVQASPPTLADDLELGWIHGGGFFAGGHVPNLPPPPPEAPVLVTIEAVAEECQPCEATFQMWVEPEFRRLRVRRV